MFLDHVLKAMRSTIPKSQSQNGLGLGGEMGKDIFTQIFDEELAKKMAGNGGRSLADILYRDLEKVIDRRNPDNSAADDEKKNHLIPLSQPVQVKFYEPKKGGLEKSENDLPIRPKYDPLKIPPVATNRPDEISVKYDGKSTISLNSRSIASDSPNAEPLMSGKDDEMMGRFGELISRASTRYDLDPNLLTAVIRAESGGDPDAVSPAGAKGLMQLIDSTAADMGVKDAFNPEENIEGGAKYLRLLLDMFGDLKKALAAYNSGPATVKKYGGIPPYRETRNYVERVMQVLKLGAADLQ
jgi:hypothetical protein